MRKLIYAMGVSLDGFIAAPGDKIDWTAPDDELHSFHNEREREVSVDLYGRRLYETMRVWTTPEELPDSDVTREFAQLWKETPKLVFSRTLESVDDDFTLVKGDAVEEVKRLKEEPGGPLAVGGAGLASNFVRAGLVDEYHLFVYPVILGGGTPFFPALERRIELELIETRTFGASRVVYSRYEAKS